MHGPSIPGRGSSWSGYTASLESFTLGPPWAQNHQTYVLFLAIQLQALRVKWSDLRLPWVDLDWLLDISCQITELDLSANCLPSLPSIIPWGLINLKKLNLSNNHLGELPCVQSSDEIICSRWAQERAQGPLCPPIGGP